MKITYENKISIQNDESVARKNKVTDTDMNEIKEVVNANANEQTTMQSDITNIKAEQTNQNNRLDLLEASNTIYNFKGKVDTLANLQLKTKTEGDVWYCEEDSTYYTYTGTDWIPVNLNLKLGVIDELQAKTIKCLQEVETPTPVSGTSIDLNDSAEAKINELKISGNSKQETSTQSRNICFTDFNEWESGEYNGQGNKTDISSRLRLKELLKVETSTTYYFNTFLTNYKIIVRTCDENKTVVRSIGPVDNGGTITTSETECYLMVTLYNSVSADGVTYDTYKTLFTDNSIKPYICLDSETDKSYDEYSVAMPSPDYQSENESCGDNINKFLLPETEEKNGIKYVNNGNGTFNINGTATADTVFTSWIPIKEIKNNTAYTLSANIIENIEFRFEEYTGKQGNWIKQYCKLGTTQKINPITTTVVKGEGTYVRFSINISSGITVNLTNVKVKLEEGSTPTPFSPYGQGCINEVICNKNIFDGKVESGNINSSGVNYADSTMIRSKNYTQVNSNENIIISNNGIALQVNIVEYDKDYVFISRTYVNATYFKTSDNTKYIKFVTSTITNPKIQIEEGTTATPYEEHKSQTYTIPTQQPFGAVGDIRDTFINKDNKWYERHYVSRKIFDGTETFKYSSGTSVIYTDVFTDRILGKVNFSCNCFKVENFSDYSIMTLNTATGDRTNNYRIIFKTEYTNADDFKAWITAQYNAGTPVYVDYILETPLDIECTEEQSTILFDIEQNAKTYDKVTHIYSTDNVSSYKEVTYKKDIETLFENTLVS